MDYDNDSGQAIDPGLAAQAKAIDGDGAAPGAAPGGPTDPGAAAPGAAPGPTDYTAEAQELIAFLVACLVPLYPSLGAVYSIDVQGRVAIGVAPLLKKYDFDLAALFGRFGPEIGAAMVLLPLAGPTIAAIKHDRAAARAEKAGQGAAPAAAAASAPAASTPGGGIPDPHNLAAKA